MSQQSRVYRNAMFQRSRYLAVPCRTKISKSEDGTLDSGLHWKSCRFAKSYTNNLLCDLSLLKEPKRHEKKFTRFLGQPKTQDDVQQHVDNFKASNDDFIKDKHKLRTDIDGDSTDLTHVDHESERIITFEKVNFNNFTSDINKTVTYSVSAGNKLHTESDNVLKRDMNITDTLKRMKSTSNICNDIKQNPEETYDVSLKIETHCTRDTTSNKSYQADDRIMDNDDDVHCHQKLERRLALNPTTRDGGITFLNFHNTNENIYRALLRCMLHPLGIPDSTQGLRSGDLIDHLREVFEVDQDEHEFFIKEELENKPNYLQVNLNLIEGCGLKPAKDKEPCSPYCLVSIVNPQHKFSKNSPKHSPKNSPKVSPRVSPKLKKHFINTGGSCGSLDGDELQTAGSQKYRKYLASPATSPHSSQENDDVLRTRTVYQTTNPIWNEEFQIPIDDILTDEIHIYMCDQHPDHETENKHVHRDNHHGLRHLFRTLLHLPEFEHCGLCFLGQVVVPVKDILAKGVDNWYELTSASGKSLKGANGKCRVKLSLSHRQDFCAGGNYFTVEDYYQTAQQVYRYNFQAAIESSVTMGTDLSKQDQRILDMICLSHSISPLSQSLVNVIVMLECATENNNIAVNEKALGKAMHDLQMTWVAKQLNITTVEQKMPISDAEIVMYRKSVTNYIFMICNHLEDLPDLFPPSMDTIKTLQSKLGVTIQLLEMDLWEAKTSPHKDLMHKVLNKLEVDVDTWIEDKLSTINKHDLVKDNVIPELNTLGEIINLASSHCNLLGAVRNFFNSIGIGYYRVVSFAVEKKLSMKIRELMLEMDKYQRRYHTFHINIASSSRLSLRIYFAVRKFYSIVRDNVSRRDVFRLTISQYQQWFQETLVFWLQAFKTECMNRIERALEIEKDVVVATSLVKYSNSSVDVLSCFAKITEEWRQIDFHDPDSALMGITKITDLICDGARLYSDKIHCILERNGYYDDSEEQFDVTDRLCITLNNIEHVRHYLTELPQLLEWESICVLVSTKHENDEIGNQAMATLNRLIHTTDSEILLKSSMLINQIIEKMKVDIARYMELFTQRKPEKASSVDQLLVYLSSSLKTFHEKLMSSIYPHMIEELWITVVTLFDKQLQIGERPEYYAQMKQHLRSLVSYFSRGGLDINPPVYSNLKTRLVNNCMTTEDLILDYFETLTSSLGTPTEYFGHVALKVAYIEETRGNVTVFVKVIRGSDLPGLDTSGLSDPYVIITLHPRTMFGHLKSQRTKTVEQTLNPVFNTTFQFPNVPKEYLLVRGAVLLLSVMDRDRIGCDDFAGEIVIPLSTIPKIEMSATVDSSPVVMMPVKRPHNTNLGPYQVLRERIVWDKSAKSFVGERQKYIEQQPERTDRPSKFFNFFSFFTGKIS